MSEPKYTSINSDGLIMLFPAEGTDPVEIENNLSTIVPSLVNLHGNYPIAFKGAGNVWDVIEHNKGRFLQYREVGIRSASGIRPYLY